MDSVREVDSKRTDFERCVQRYRSGANDYKWTWKAIEFELAFLYEVFFTSNEFLHFYQAKGASIWALASFIGICLVGVATAIPGTMASRHRVASTGPPNAGTVVVETTTADLIITLAILVSLALLQLVQLIRCWTSNWARVAFACKYSMHWQTLRNQFLVGLHDRFRAPTKNWWWWMRLRAFVVTRMNWFDKYLWQDKLGQYSLVDSEKTRRVRKRHYSASSWFQLVKIVGVQYIGQVVRELLWAGDMNEPPIGLHDDVKTSVANFLGKIKSSRIGKEWSSLFVDNGIDASSLLPYSNVTLPWMRQGGENDVLSEPEAYAFTLRVMVWHVATWYCDKAEQEGGGGAGQQEKNRRVAIALSRYCAYLVVSAPELLPGPTVQTKEVFDDAEDRVREVMLRTHRQERTAAMVLEKLPARFNNNVQAAVRYFYNNYNIFWTGVLLGRQLRGELRAPPHECTRRSDDPWEVLALLWVQTLLYAAPYGDKEAHRQRLSQGGEFITHLWALLYHLGIHEWKVQSNLQDVHTIDDAKTILTEFSQGNSGFLYEAGVIVVAFLDKSVHVRTLSFYSAYEKLLLLLLVVVISTK